jgi:putative oxidoreductase
LKGSNEFNGATPMSKSILILVARILLSFIFILSGFGKLADPAATAGMITGAGLPAASALAYLAGLFELVAGVAVLVGFQTTIVGWALAAFCIFTGAVFHSGTVAIEGWPEGALGWINTLNQIMMMKNFTLAGAYILLAVVGAGAISIDARRGVAQPALA